MDYESFYDPKDSTHMGIPGLYGQWLRAQVPAAIVGGLPTLVSSLAFDLNGVLHAARKDIYGEGEIDKRILEAIAATDPAQLELEYLNRIGTIILEMVEKSQPRDVLILAVDGVAPRAKLQQQSGRREKAALESSPTEVFDRNAITPGTELMIRIDQFLVRFIGQYKNHLPPKIIYSSHLVPGEGEHKIMDFYRSGEVSGGPADLEGGAHILYGLDADLVMLSLLAPIENIFLSRETEYESVSINVIKDFLNESGNRPSAVHDFVVMMFMIGNDFLPRLPACENMRDAIALLLDIYAQGDFVLTRDGSIVWDSMFEFVKVLEAQEPELLAAGAVREVKFPSELLRGALIHGKFYPDLFRSNWYINELGARGSPDLIADILEVVNRDAEPIADLFEVTQARIAEMVQYYLTTMAWIYNYYRIGTSKVSQTWLYPYNHAPLLTDIVAVMDAPEGVTILEGIDVDVPALTALHQLVAVLPLKSVKLLPDELKPLFGPNSMMRDKFPTKFTYELDGKNYEHEGIPIIPLVDRRRLIDAVGQIYFDPKRALRWMPAQAQVFERTEAEAAMIARIERRNRRDTVQRKPRQQREPRPGEPKRPYIPKTTGEPKRPYIPKTTGEPKRPYIPKTPGKTFTQPTTQRPTTQPTTIQRTTTRGGAYEVHRPPKGAPAVKTAPTPKTVPKMTPKAPVFQPAKTPTTAIAAKQAIPDVPMIVAKKPAQKPQVSPAKWKGLPPLM